ncbi:protein FANTASTIC FOUR 1-like [Syzygium oleosum]|uniref:protein FANTASTIC FOUR 1-like n=1 Tax=Syzygium oleosum TaxID=219896 RepID=UPI0024BA13A1|nr:protein FANTASTIC FOUR 1-like [Syzygium oleosum]
MSSSVCQGLQSCLESRRVEPRVLRLKLAPRRPSADSDAAAKMKAAAAAEAQPGADAADRSFLHAFANADEKGEGEGEQGAVYVHPLVKCSSSFLSDRSLEMCTESLGSETGSDVSDGDAPLLSPGGGRDGYHRPAIQPARKKPSQSRSFPPPLTSVSGSMGVEVRSRREGGRLVVEAVVVSSPCNFFQVERSHGRLRVRFSEESDAPETEAEEEEEDEDEEEEEVEAESEEAEEEEEEEVNVTVEGEDFDYEEFEEEEEEEEGKGMEGNGGFAGGEIGNGKCLRPSMVRCKEGAAMNWKPKPCWVAT